MPRLLRHSLARLRLPALAVLLLAVVANPLLAALGDLHELGEGNAHLHSLAEHRDGGNGSDAHRDPHGGGHDGGDLLHALMHASHCCGHPTALTSWPMPSLAFVPADAPVPPVSRPPPAVVPDSTLRPPIAA